jgi:hypothetical protein
VDRLGEVSYIMSDHIERGSYRAFLRAGAISIGVIVLIFAAELVVIAVKGLPPVFGSAESWLAALHKDRFLGIVQTFGLDIVAVAFHAPLYIAFFLLLKPYGKGYGTLILAAVLSFIGIAVYFTSNQTFSMLYLSDKLYSAVTEAERVQVLTSAQSIIAVWNGTGPIIATNLYGISGILVSIVMIQTRRFPLAVAITGIVGNALQLGPPVSIMPPLYLRIDPYLVGIGGVVLIVWYVIVAPKLWNPPNDP